MLGYKESKSMMKWLMFYTVTFEMVYHAAIAN